MRQSKKQSLAKVAKPEYCRSCYRALVDGACPSGHDCSLDPLPIREGQVQELHLALATCSGVLLALKDEVRWTTQQKRGIEAALMRAEQAMARVGRNDPSVRSKP